MRKFTNTFKDASEAVYDKFKKEVFWYVFSSDAYVVAEDLSRYRFATDLEKEALIRSGDRYTTV